MKLLIKECQEIALVIQKLEGFALEQAQKESKNKNETVEVNPHLFYATGRIKKMLTSRILSDDAGYRPVYMKFIEFHGKKEELRRKHTKEVKEKGKKSKQVLDKETYDKEYKELEKKYEKDIKIYLEFQKKEVEFNGTLYKISVKHLPPKVPIDLMDDLNDFDLLQE